MSTATENGLAAQLVQLAPLVKRVIDALKPVIDQPVIRFPYNLPLARSQVIQPGLSNQPLLQSDFSHSLEFPFEVESVHFSQDPSHTARDWRIAIKDLVFNMDWQKASVMVATLVDTNTSAWKLDFPWVVRPKGGGLVPFVDNLDVVNPITVDIDFRGYLLIPRA